MGLTMGGLVLYPSQPLIRKRGPLQFLRALSSFLRVAWVTGLLCSVGGGEAEEAEEEEEEEEEEEASDEDALLRPWQRGAVGEALGVRSSDVMSVILLLLCALCAPCTVSRIVCSSV